MRAVTLAIIVSLAVAAAFCGYVALGETLALLAAARHGGDGQAVFSVIIAVLFWLIAAAAAFAAIRLFQQRRGR